ncbi:septin-1-like [Oppia nitens]|uniref:septin-1-like n=1 Tax=Oppia nitens TaxID=1686743 RepID=UPI0023DADD92|nr:septin-1-like [Oppia nitens]
MSVETTNYLGFGNLPNQVHRKYVKKGFEFTLMVVGDSGLGKSTLIKSMFASSSTAATPGSAAAAHPIGVQKARRIPPVSDQLESTLKIETNTLDIEERGVKLKLTVVDTPGFGDSLDSSDCCRPIIDYIDEQYEKYLNHESGLNRRHINDTRIHCLFYFISPNNYGLKPLDIQTMKSLHQKVNVIPIVAKSDFLTKDELLTAKKRILADLKAQSIQIYSIPDCDPDEDEDYKEQVRQLKSAIPFAVSSSLETYEVKGRKVRGRSYPWGIVETENPEHSDFVKLRTMLVTHMQDLREVTQDLHYENYRSQRLVNKTTSGSSNSDLRSNYGDSISIASSADDLQRDRLLQEKEAELHRMQEMIDRMQKEMQMNQKQLSSSSSGTAAATHVGDQRHQQHQQPHNGSNQSNGSGLATD